MTREEQMIRAEAILKEYWGKKTAPPTNYDRIISKTPEELAEMFSKKFGCNDCPWGSKSCNNRCKEAWLSWLKSPAEVMA